ncbi:hypothetical protein D3C85_1113350 [compost metagenome]
MRAGRQAARGRNGQEGAEHRVIAQDTDAQRDQHRIQAGGFPAFDEIPRDAIEAEARALQHDAERRAQQDGQRQAAAALGQEGQQPRGKKGGRQHQDGRNMAQDDHSGLAPNRASRIADGRSDTVAVLGPRAIVVAHVVAQQLAQREP